MNIIRVFILGLCAMAGTGCSAATDGGALAGVLSDAWAAHVSPVGPSACDQPLPQASKKERDEFALRIKANPRNYIAQPTLALSTAPTLCDGVLEPRHLDLRPFILQGRDLYCTTGGLSRVALKKGSLVVNSSQGGGSKDTWIINDEV